MLRRYSSGQWTARYAGSLENRVLFQSARGLEQVTPSLGARDSPWVFWLASLQRNQDTWKGIVSDYSFIACAAHWRLGFQCICTFYSSWTILFNWVTQVHSVFFPLLGWRSKCYHREISHPGLYFYQRTFRFHSRCCISRGRTHFVWLKGLFAWSFWLASPFHDSGKPGIAEPKKQSHFQSLLRLQLPRFF